MAETLRVLITDDEEEMCHVVRRALRRHAVTIPDIGVEVKYEVDEASSGEEALEKIRETAPDILLLDIRMPGMSGLEVLDIVSQEHQDIPTVMVTAYASIQTAVSATKQGAFDFLPKPFTPEELRFTVQKATRHLITSREARKLAEEKKRVRFEFISVLAHELKSPLSAVEGYLYTLEDEGVRANPDMFDKVITKCEARLAGMRKMIMDLLDMTRVESGSKKREMEPVDLRDAAEAAVDGVTAAAQERNISLNLDAPGDLALTADRGEMEIILNNLVSNAVKYNRDGGSVNVRIRREDDRFEVEVEDTGIGLTEEEAGRLFHDFVRIRNRETKGVLGTGLGLSIVRRLAQLYGGDATVESVKGEGSTFRVALMELEQPAAEIEAEIAAPGASE